MKEFEKIVIGKSSVPALIITVVLMIAVPIALFIYWRRKHKEQTNISWLIAGALGFIVSTRMLEFGVHYFCILAVHQRKRGGFRPVWDHHCRRFRRVRAVCDSEIRHEKEPHP